MIYQKNKVCNRCGKLMTWDEQRLQFGRLMRKGYSQDEAKRILPRCGKCVTESLRTYELTPLER